MIRKSVFILYCLLMLQAVGAAQEPAPKVSYQTLLERVKKQDPGVDFKELRIAYTETKEYNPYGGDMDSSKAMMVALEAKQYDKTLALSDKVLASNYLDINAHIAAYAANNQLGLLDKATSHKYVFQGLLRSISNSGDGKTMETAFFVISVDEEYALLSIMQLRPTAQTRVEDRGHNYDRMIVLDPKTNQTSTYYFNIDKPFNWLSNSLKS